ncbi:MAG: hypothetical protein IPP73_01045 [Chitinophagaceae bacterium]|nr:hypothetical protein [Chitinophagaceae bacterium]
MKHKKTLIIAILLVIIAIGGYWGVRNFLLNKPAGEEATADLYQPESFDKKLIDQTAKKVEDVFTRADTAALAAILSPESLEQKRQYFSEIRPYMEGFGKAFRNRKLIFATARYAEYSFDSPSGEYTVGLCLGPDCTWKLMRY